MELHLNIVGCLLIFLALIHIGFSKYFNWKKELEPLSLINRQMMKIHTFFLALTIFLMGLLCLTSGSDLQETNLGKQISYGLAIFWFLRLLVQFFGYSKELWKGKKLETFIHFIFTILWLYFSYVFFSVANK